MLQPRQHPRPCSSGRHASCTAPRSVRVSVRRGRAANSRSTPSQEWARSWHIEKGPKGDLDWHIELTQSAKTDSFECVVVEIPDPKYGAFFGACRPSTHPAEIETGGGQSKNDRLMGAPLRRVTPRTAAIPISRRCAAAQALHARRRRAGRTK